MDIKKRIRERSKMGLSGIFKTYFNDGVMWVLFKGYFIPATLAAIITQWITYKRNVSLITYLNEINQIPISILPDLLGFNLGAFTLFIAFGGTSFLKTIVGFEDDRAHSLYQKNSSIFSVAILIQIFTLLIAIIVRFFLELKLSIDSQFISEAINRSVIFLLIFSTISSVYILKDIVVNIWNLAQLYHLNVWLEREDVKESNICNRKPDNDKEKSKEGQL